MHSAVAPEPGGRSPEGPGCRAAAGRDTQGREAQSLLSLSPGPLHSRRVHTGPGVAADENNNTVMCMEPLAMCEAPPILPAWLAAAMELLGFPRDTDFLPKVTAVVRLPFLPGHILKHPSASVPAPRSRGPGSVPLTGCSPPSQAVCESGAPQRWRSGACPWSSPSCWAPACSPLSGTVPRTPPGTSCGSACPRSRTPVG